MQTTLPIRQSARARRGLLAGMAGTAVLASILAYTNGFWLTALLGATGAIERTGEPFSYWLAGSALIIPLMLPAILAARRLSAGRFAGSRVGRLATALLVVGISSGLGIALAAASAAYDYSFQKQHLGHIYNRTGLPSGAEQAGFAAAPSLPFTLYCDLRGTTVSNPTAQMEYATLMVHVRALGLISILLVLNNLLVVSTVLALRGSWLQPRPAQQDDLQRHTQAHV